MLDDAAAQKVTKYINEHDVSTDEGLARLIQYSHAVATKYGEGSAALSAQMYDAVAALQNADVPPAVPAQTATYNETARAVQGARLFSDKAEVTAGAVSRLVKTAGADTTLQNAARDGAQFAWVPSGDTCAFCITLASRGWQRMSRKAIEGGHAEHIHNNCDCTYAIRFSDNDTVEGYDPEVYRQMYYGAEGTSPEAKINYMRRQFYAKNKGTVGANSSKAEEFIPKTKAFSLRPSDFAPAASIKDAENYASKSFVNGSFGLTGKSVNLEGFSLDMANAFNKRLSQIYATFDIPKLSSLESFSKKNRKIWAQNKDAPMFSTNFGNLGLNSGLIKTQTDFNKYIKDEAAAYNYVISNMDKLTGNNRAMAEAYKAAGKSLVGNTPEDFITHEIGHHISYIGKVNKSLYDIQRNDDWRKYAKKLSGYANHSFGEYFAESFAAYCKGERSKLQPAIIDIFEGLLKK